MYTFNVFKVSVTKTIVDCHLHAILEQVTQFPSKLSQEASCG